MIFIAASMLGLSAGVPAPGAFAQEQFGAAGFFDLATILANPTSGSKPVSFSATLEYTMRDVGGVELSRIVTYVAMLDGKMRWETVDAFPKHTKTATDATAKVRQQMSTGNIYILIPDKRTSYFIYPGIRSYIATTRERSAIKKPGMEQIELGKETVDGHPCVKTKLIMPPSPMGERLEMIGWLATDLNRFPLRMEMENSSNGTTMTARLKALDMATPAASLFEPPADFMCFGSSKEMMTNAVQRVTQQEAEKPAE